MELHHLEDNSHDDWLMRNMALVASGILRRDGQLIGRGEDRGQMRALRECFVVNAMFDNLTQDIKVRIRKVDANGNY
jgi:hypothetical protein